MANYEYRCEACGHCWDVLKRMSLMDREEACPECGHVGERLISGGGHIVFNGEGFHGVDYPTRPRENPKKKYGRGSGTISQKVVQMHPEDPVPTKGNK